jgi:hypothetical protein
MPVCSHCLGRGFQPPAADPTLRYGREVPTWCTPCDGRGGCYFDEDRRDPTLPNLYEERRMENLKRAVNEGWYRMQWVGDDGFRGYRSVPYDWIAQRFLEQPAEKTGTEG